ncbi:unnamed protein product [Aphanomyces euteiches]|uniref:MI domain-containing protein n=1 Tax=Aphanomyces euteiches TaxID=100861 RepID=A0A6G0WIG6_9STRA|nr:hypothetical protein Ae201684_014856 [Aphanomyces euteiches]KAH9072727.1 hypothetical protein Ae201684P_015799 [Aphanomyces euteiches]KAH9151713.1 hypothetical protein AeRB84_005727 [Aphanomyces euteiches]
MVDTTKSKLNAKAPAFVLSANAPSWQPSNVAFTKPAAPVPSLNITAKEFVPSFVVPPAPVVVQTPVVVEPVVDEKPIAPAVPTVVPAVAEPVVVVEKEVKPVEEVVEKEVKPIEKVVEKEVKPVEKVVEKPAPTTVPAPTPAVVKIEPEEESHPTSPISVASTESTPSPSESSEKQASPGRKRRITYTVAELLEMEPATCPVPTGLVLCLGVPGESKAARAAFTKPEHHSRGKKSHKKHKQPSHHKNHIDEDSLPPVKPLSINEETRWKPKIALGAKEELTTDDYLKQVQSILNKLSVEKFDRLSDQLIEVAVTNEEVLQGSIDMVVKKAQMEWHFSTMYAELCGKMARTDMPLISDTNAAKLFRTLLLTRCQKEFEVSPLTALDAEGEHISEEARQEKALVLKRATLGHIRFIGELYKQGMLSARIMHECIQRLFGNLEAPDEESLECLCKLLATVGARMEERAAAVPTEAALFKQYFDLIASLSKAKDKLCTRVRFMLQDLIDMRANKYVARLKEAKATTIAEIHAQVAREEKAKTSSGPPPSSGKPKFHKSQSMASLPPPPSDGWNTIPSKVKLTKSVSAELRNPPRSEKRNDERSKPRPRRGSVERERRHTIDRPNIPRVPVETPPAAAPAPPQKSQALPPQAPKERDEEAVKKSAKSMFKEFVYEQDIAEVQTQLHDALKYSMAVTTTVINYALEQKQAERAAVGPFLSGLVSANLLEVAGIVSAVNDLLEFLEDVEIDIPKAGLYLSEMVAPLVGENVLALDQINFAVLPEAKQSKVQHELASVLATLDVKDNEAVQAFIAAHNN